ncbi:RNA polymerase factor sigma-54 [bacterium]|nr:RNA polymerase factor sigma-54 [bacterium]
MAKLSLSQEATLKQELVLTPQLILTQKLLQLTRLELNYMLNQELQTNPCLDVLEEREKEGEELPSEIAESRENQEAAELEEELVDWKRFYDGMELSYRNLEEPTHEDRPSEPTIAGHNSLWEDLFEQLTLANLTPREFRIGEFIIGNLDNRGYFTMAPEEVVLNLNIQNPEEQTYNDQEIEKVLKVVQQFEPAGIAARDLRECFLLQLDNLGFGEQDLVYNLVKSHFVDLTRKNFPQLSKVMKTTQSHIEKAIHILSTLTFAPAEGYETRDIKLEPDLIVKKDRGEWKIIYNYSSLPVLAVNKEYLKLLQSYKTLNEETKEFLKNKLNSAKMWINSLEQREHTLLGTMRAILNHQMDFFENGPGHLKPLKMEEVADTVGVDISTISRVVNAKHVQTSYGTFSLRSFFVGGLKTETGEDLSTTRVQRLIKKLVDNEDKKHPLSDQKIADILNNDKGVQIARRTIAKYRDLLSIPPARMRKR